MGTSPTLTLYRSVSFSKRAIASSEEVPFGIVKILPGWLAFNAVTAFFGQMPIKKYDGCYSHNFLSVRPILLIFKLGRWLDMIYMCAKFPVDRIRFTEVFAVQTDINVGYISPKSG